MTYMEKPLDLKMSRKITVGTYPSYSSAYSFMTTYLTTLHEPQTDTPSIKELVERGSDLGRDTTGPELMVWVGLLLSPIPVKMHSVFLPVKLPGKARGLASQTLNFYV